VEKGKGFQLVCLFSFFFLVGFWFFVLLGSLFFLEKERLFFLGGRGFCFSDGGGDGGSYGMESPQSFLFIWSALLGMCWNDFIFLATTRVV